MFQIHRAVDAEMNVLVYTVVSTKPTNGSPFNSISVVPGEMRELCLGDGSRTATRLNVIED